MWRAVFCLRAVAPPEEVARCADAAVREVVRQSAEAAGMDVESGRLASATVDQGKVSDAAIAADVKNNFKKIAAVLATTVCLSLTSRSTQSYMILSFLSHFSTLG